MELAPCLQEELAEKTRGVFLATDRIGMHKLVGSVTKDCKGIKGIKG